MKNLIFCLVFLNVTVGCIGQVKEIKVGENVRDLGRDYILRDVFNYSKDSVKLSDLNGRATIFDFGRINCGPCVANLPRLDSMQLAHGNDLQIFWVVDQSDSMVKDFLRNNKIGRNLHIGVIANDTLLNEVFHYFSFPAEVWLDRYLNVNGILTSELDNRESLKGLLNPSK